MTKLYSENRRQTGKRCEALFRFGAAMKRKSTTLSVLVNGKVVSL